MVFYTLVCMFFAISAGERLEIYHSRNTANALFLGQKQAGVDHICGPSHLFDENKKWNAVPDCYEGEHYIV